jgi:hypothetical protein
MRHAGEGMLDVKAFAQLCQELILEFLALITEKLPWAAMKGNPMLQQGLGCGVSSFVRQGY